MPPSLIPSTYPLEYVFEKTAESILGYLRISKPEKALQVLLDLQAYLKSLPIRSFQSQNHMEILVGRVREGIRGMKSDEEETASMLLGVLETLERIQLLESDGQARGSHSQEQDIDMVDEEEEDCMVEEGDVECKRCGHIIPNRRLAKHIEFWCQPS